MRTLIERLVATTSVALGTIAAGCGSSSPPRAPALEDAIAECRANPDRCAARCHKQDEQHACRAQIVLVAEGDATMRKWLASKNVRFRDLKPDALIEKAGAMCVEGIERGCRAKAFFEAKREALHHPPDRSCASPEPDSDEAAAC